MFWSALIRIMHTPSPAILAGKQLSNGPLSTDQHWSECSALIRTVQRWITESCDQSWSVHSMLDHWMLLRTEWHWTELDFTCCYYINNKKKCRSNDWTIAFTYITRPTLTILPLSHTVFIRHWTIILYMSFSCAPSQTSLGKHQCSIWSQTTLNPFLFLHHHHPPQRSHPFRGLTTSPTATTAHYHHRPPTPTTTATPGNATSLAVTPTRTATDNEERPRTTTPTNGNVAMPCHSPQQPPEQLQATTRQGQPAHPPPAFFFSNTKCRCHIAISDMATKRQPRIIVCCCC